MSHVMIAGSATIGENCWIGPSTSIINRATVGNNVYVGIGTNIIRDIPDGVKIVGNPSREI